MNTLDHHHDSAWHRRFGARLRAHWRFKLFFSVLLPLGFFAVYFPLLYFPVFPVTEMPITAIDRLIGFWSTSLLVYITLWIYIPLGSWILDDKRELVVCTAAICGLGMVGLTVFFLWPSAVPRPHIDLAEYPSFRSLVAIDEPRNVFPSLHASFAVFTAVCIGRVLREQGGCGLLQGLNWCWCLGILYSALATKQHLGVDLLAGMVLGAAWAGLTLRVLTRRRAGVAGVSTARADQSTQTAPIGSDYPSTSGFLTIGEAMPVAMDDGSTHHGNVLVIHDQ